MVVLTGRTYACLLIVLFVLSHCTSASAQSVDRVGSDATFDVATWNIEWFGATGSGQGPSNIQQQRANVKRIILEAGIDLWAVQEISDTQQFQLLLNELGPPWDGDLATESGQQRIGFIYNTDVVHVRSVGHILDSFSYAFASRPPLQLDMDVSLPDTTFQLMAITVHMKCCSAASDYDRRVEAAGRMKTHIDYFYGLAGHPIGLVLGDFNDELSASIRIGNPSPYTAFLDDPSRYAFLTWPLDQQNTPTYCSNSVCSYGSTLDHILITSKLFSHHQAASVGRLESVLTAISGFTNTTSDHLPVYAVFSFPTSTASEAAKDLPQAFSIQEAFPNPARQNLTISFDAANAGLVEVNVFDAIGRIVLRSSTQASMARNSMMIDISGLSQGLYLLKLSSGRDTDQRIFLKRN